MSADEHQHAAGERPHDPAGSTPRHDPASVLPSGEGPLLRAWGSAGLAQPAPAGPAPAAAMPAGPEVPVVERAEPADPPVAAAAPHAARFQFLFGVLLAVGAAAIVLFAAAVLRGDDTTTTTTQAGGDWAAWVPSRSSSNTVPQQIAAYVAPRYRLDDGQQAVLVDGGPLKVADLPLTVALRLPSSAGGGVHLFENKKSVLYRLCGLGDRCGVPGTPTLARHALLRREAFELALFTFHYTDADQVVAFMPPHKGQKSSEAGQALFFQRDQLRRFLSQPLDSVLTTDVPRPAEVPRASDRLLVDQQTFPVLYNFELKQANQDNSGFLVLSSIPLSSLKAPAAKPKTTQTKPA